jgi:hypothetical protein
VSTSEAASTRDAVVRVRSESITADEGLCDGVDVGGGEHTRDTVVRVRSESVTNDEGLCDGIDAAGSEHTRDTVVRVRAIVERARGEGGKDNRAEQEDDGRREGGIMSEPMKETRGPTSSYMSAQSVVTQ